MNVTYLCYPAARPNTAAYGVYMESECAGDDAVLTRLIEDMRAAGKTISVFPDRTFNYQPNRLAVGIPA